MITTRRTFFMASSYCHDFNENHKEERFYNGCLNLMMKKAFVAHLKDIPRIYLSLSQIFLCAVTRNLKEL